MKNFNALELLRLVTFLPLIVVLFAIAGEDQIGAFQHPDQIVSHELPYQDTCFWEG